MSQSISIENHITLYEGRAQAVIGSLNGHKIGIINIYASNQDIARKEFFDTILAKIQNKIKVECLVLGGDFNTIQNSL